MSRSKEEFEQLQWVIQSSTNDLQKLIERMDARDAAWAQKQLEEQQENQNGN
jgi:hypothetical protein